MKGGQGYKIMGEWGWERMEERAREKTNNDVVVCHQSPIGGEG
jgi:hypothetical protein